MADGRSFLKKLWAFGKGIRMLLPGFQSPPGSHFPVSRDSKLSRASESPREILHPGARRWNRKAQLEGATKAFRRELGFEKSWRIFGGWFQVFHVLLVLGWLGDAEIMLFRGAENLRPAGDLVLLPGQQCRQWLEMWWEEMTRRHFENDLNIFEHWSYCSLKKSDQDKELEVLWKLAT